MFFMSNYRENCLSFLSPHPLFRPSPRSSWWASEVQSKSLFVPPVTYRCRSPGLHREWHLPLRHGTQSPPNKWNTLSMSAGTDVKPPVDANLELRNLKIEKGTTKCTYERDSIFETYNLVEIPSATALLVGDFKDVILQNLSLVNVLTDLDRAVDLMFLAYVGVVGQGLITADVGDRQYELQELCAECLRTMNIFGQCCESTLNSMKRAFESLLEGEEEIAARTLERCKTYSSRMSSKCKDLSDSFKRLRDDTNGDCRNVQVQVESQAKKLQELEDARAEWQANVAEQKSISDNLEITINQLQEDIDAETARQKVESDREFAVAVMGALTKSLSAGLGMNSSDDSSTEKDSTSKPAASATATKPKPTSSGTTETGKGSGEKDEKGTGSGVSPGSEKPAAVTPNSSTIDVRLRMNEQKRNEQKKRRDALATIARLQTKLKNNQSEEQIAESTVTALQISIFAMDNITVALDRAKFFWDSMTTYCANLSQDKLFRYHSLGEKKSKEKRIEFYKGRIFLPNAIGFSIKWKALQVVCEDYAKSAEKCKLKAEKNIGTDVTIANCKTMLRDTNAMVEKSLSKQQRLVALHQQALERERSMLELKQQLVANSS